MWIVAIVLAVGGVILTRRPLGRGSTVLQLIKSLGAEGVFSPEDLSVLVAAFDEAWAGLEKSGVRFDSDYERQRARNMLGKYIIEEAKNGEHDKSRLSQAALLLYSQSGLRSAS
jgi:hypothetical protein